MSHLRALGILAAGIWCLRESAINKWQKNYFKVNADGSDYDQKLVFNNNDHFEKACKYGIPFRDTHFKSNIGYELSYDKRTRLPSWVSEHLTQDTINSWESETLKDYKIFCKDKRTKNFGASDADYQNQCGFVKGQLAAKRNHVQGYKKYKETFLYSNVAPQIELFNNGAWEDLESYARYVTCKYDDVYVITGPLYTPDGDQVNYQVIGQNFVAVPTHFFKVIIGEIKCDQRLKIGCYIMPNEAIPECKPLSDFLVPIEEVEKRAGFLLFKEKPCNEPLYDERGYRERRRQEKEQGANN